MLSSNTKCHRIATNRIDNSLRFLKTYLFNYLCNTLKTIISTTEWKLQRPKTHLSLLYAEWELLGFLCNAGCSKSSSGINPEIKILVQYFCYRESIAFFTLEVGGWCESNQWTRKLKIDKDLFGPKSTLQMLYPKCFTANKKHC